MTRPKARQIAAIAAATVVAAMLAGCVSTGGSADPAVTGEDAPGQAVLQSKNTGPDAEPIDNLVSAFEAQSGKKLTVNEINSVTFMSQLPTYLTAKNPPDMYTYFAGAATRAYADQGLLMDLSSVWDKDLSNYPEALRKLSQDESGSEVFVPTSYYWWGVYYKKSVFEKLGVTPPTTWDEFMTVADKIQDQGVTPIGIGLSDSKWLASAWFDYLDVRINGGEFHLDLLAGKHKFTDPEVVKVMETFETVLPYFDAGALGTTMAQSQTDFSQGKTAMYLSGSFLQGSMPEDQLEDLAFFKFPVIDPSVPDVEEAPTDGYVASARAAHPGVVKEFMAFVASTEAQEALLADTDGRQLAANPDAKIESTPLLEQGKKMLESADQLTQFFNRDASDALQPTADAALTEFMSKPEKLQEILATWEQAAERARAAQ